MKVNNPDWDKLGVDPTDITLRNRVGESFDPSDAERIGEAVERMLASQGEWAQRIEGVRNELIFNLGHGGEAAGEYLLEAMLAKQEERKKASGEGA